MKRLISVNLFYVFKRSWLVYGYNKVKKDTFDSMNNVINETKKDIELQPKMQKMYNEVDTYIRSYKSLEQENAIYKKKLDI